VVRWLALLRPGCGWLKSRLSNILDVLVVLSDEADEADEVDKEDDSGCGWPAGWLAGWQPNQISVEEEH